MYRLKKYLVKLPLISIQDTFKFLMSGESRYKKYVNIWTKEKEYYEKKCGDPYDARR